MQLMQLMQLRQQRQLQLTTSNMILWVKYTQPSSLGNSWFDIIYSGEVSSIIDRNQNYMHT